MQIEMRLPVNIADGIPDYSRGRNNPLSKEAFALVNRRKQLGAILGWLAAYPEGLSPKRVAEKMGVTHHSISGRFSEWVAGEYKGVLPDIEAVEGKRDRGQVYRLKQFAEVE